MTPFTIYDSTGKISGTGHCQSELLTMQPLKTGESVVTESANLLTDYYNNGAKTARPTMAVTLDKTAFAADGIDKITFTGAPANATITAKGKLPNNMATGPCGNPDIFSTQIADTYTVTISLWPYLDFTTTVTAS